MSIIHGRAIPGDRTSHQSDGCGCGFRQQSIYRQPIRIVASRSLTVLRCEGEFYIQATRLQTPPMSLAPVNRDWQMWPEKHVGA